MSIRLLTVAKVVVAEVEDMAEVEVEGINREEGTAAVAVRSLVFNSLQTVILTFSRKLWELWIQWGWELWRWWVLKFGWVGRRLGVWVGGGLGGLTMRWHTETISCVRV